MVIPGEVGQTFDVSENGYYSVEVKLGNCIDTSNCILVDNVYLKENSDLGEIKVYPNPSEGEFWIDRTIVNGEIEIFIYDVFGKLVTSLNLLEPKLYGFNLGGEKGVYFLLIRNDSKSKIIRLVMK